MDGGNIYMNDTFEQGASLSSENNHLCIQNMTPDSLETFNENNIGTTLPCVSLDHFDFALPPTPESSHHSCSENGETLLLDNSVDIVESNFADDFSVITNLLVSPVDLDLMKSQVHGNIHTEEAVQGTVPNCILDAQVLEFPSEQKSEKSIPLEKEKDEISRCDTSRKLGLQREGTDGKTDKLVSNKVENIPKKIPVSKSCAKNMKASSLLQFPPCVICSGKATGSHYGAITCEACKGFFRRYLQKKKDFKCNKGGNCEIVITSKKGICSGCRLKKCLDLGMSKEKSKMGRYTLTKRTEAIINMNIHDRKQFDDLKQMGNDEVNDENVIESNTESNTEGNSLLVTQLMKGPKSLNLSRGFNDLLISELVQCFNVFEPYGPNVKTKEEIAQAHKRQSEKYKQKVEMFGKMKAIPREEYNEIYTQYGIDIDGRMADMKLDCEDMDSDMAFYCNFAKHIPEFHSFPLQDQVSLLNTLIIEFFSVVFIDCYNDEYQTFIYRNGQGRHFEEIAGRELSEELVTLSKNVYCRLQTLNLNTEERALMAALTLVSADRCKLQNRALVEKVQLSLTELLQAYLKKNRKEAGNGRFTKIIDSLTYMRELSDKHRIENNEMCQDEVLQKEFPFIKEFYIKEIDEFE